MKKIKMVLVMVMAIGITLNISNINVSAKQKYDLKLYNQIEKQYGNFSVYEPDELSDKKLANRNGKIIIEKYIGVVKGHRNGQILNTKSKYNYISYKGIKGVKKGNIVITYVIYNPNTNYTDDIIMRFDYVIKKNS